MGKKDEQKQRPYTSGSAVDDLTDWAVKIKALGEVWSALSWHENREGGGGSQALESCGERLGEIIMDYADLIERTVNENSTSFVDLDSNIVFSLTRSQEVYDWTCSANQNASHIPDISHIEYQLSVLSEFIENAALPAIRLKNSFEELKKNILAGRKKAPGAVMSKDILITEVSNAL